MSPRTHGSGLFTRGQTQIMSLCTLGTAKEGQRIDDLSLEGERRYMHHYNFPPYSVGETGFMRGPKRRDIGHGALAQRALEPVIPGPEEFPYTIRIVSETLESNGSSSMGSVCGSTLALMDAGVPIKAPVGGIAMGLVKEGEDYVILTDIQGAEDHLGDMDFKVAGTREGVTALQMDIKITGVTREILSDALEQAKRAREFILDRMAEAIPEPRTELAGHAPRISSISIDPDQIGLVIGKGGETIRALEADYDVQIDIEEDGTVLVYATEGDKADAAIASIAALTKEPEVGDTYTGRVVKTTDFGAFVELKKGTDGLLHVSNVGPGRVGRIEDVIDRGDVLDVVVQEIDKQRGRIGLKLVAKHEDGKFVQPEELIERAKVAAADAARGATAARRRPRRRGGRGGHRREREEVLRRMKRARAPARPAPATPRPRPRTWPSRNRASTRPFRDHSAARLRDYDQSSGGIATRSIQVAVAPRARPCPPGGAYASTALHCRARVTVRRAVEQDELPGEARGGKVPLLRVGCRAREGDQVSDFPGGSGAGVSIVAVGSVVRGDRDRAAGRRLVGRIGDPQPRVVGARLRV